MRLLLELFKNRLRVIRNKKRFPQASIESFLINKTAKIGENSIISRGAAIGPNVEIANNCMITPNVHIGSNVTIDQYSYVNPDTRILSGKIGKYCSISYGCKIGMSDHPIDYISTSPYTYGKSNIFNTPAYFNEYHNPPVIGNDVWIGANVVILQGTIIGNGAIIAAGAIVNKDVPSYTIVGGVPAKPIKTRFTADKIAYLNELKWWDKSQDEVLKLKGLFAQKENWLKTDYSE